MPKMQYLHFFSCISMLLLCSGMCRALACEVNDANKGIAITIEVSKSGEGQFETIQSAIDSIPPSNSQWTRIRISPGIYKEKVTIPQDKPCIFLEGAGTKLTSVEWDAHADTASSTTFASNAEDIIVKGITFKNTYNRPYDLSMASDSVSLKQAVAVGVLGDRTVFYNCSFLGVQDTLWDAYGRHFFQNCYIQGGVDFIFGNGQSIYENCVLRYSFGDYATSYNYGYLTANGRGSADDPSGFVFRRCRVIGKGQAYLGRAWNAFSRVIFVDSFLSDVVVPEGWWAWNHVGHEENITFAEANNTGPGADTSKRVPWLKKVSDATIGQLLNISFIDKDGWIERLPIAN